MSNFKAKSSGTTRSQAMTKNLSKGVTPPTKTYAHFRLKVCHQNMALTNIDYGETGEDY